MIIDPAVASVSSQTPVHTSVTIDRPADRRRPEATQDTDKENLRRAEERRVAETRSQVEARPTRSAEGKWIGTTISTVA